MKKFLCFALVIAALAVSAMDKAEATIKAHHMQTMATIDAVS